MNVIQIVQAHLVANGFDGLFNYRMCACETADLAPCGNIMAECCAGHKTPCDCGEHAWHINETQPKENPIHEVLSDEPPDRPEMPDY